MEKKETIDKIYVAQFGTYDLPSLGDTMFPRIFLLEMRERFGESIAIDLYSPCGTNHPDNDLPVIHAMDELKVNHEKHPYSLFVIGGGEFVHFSPVDYISVDNEKKTYGVGELWEKPQRIAEELGIPVVWNCLGVSRDIVEDSEIARIYNSCKNIHYISVRDDYSASRLNFILDNANVNTVADMLWMFNKHFPQEMLDEYFFNLQKEYSFLKEKYIIIQYGTSRLYKEIAEVIESFAKKQNITVLAFVVNYCHEDLAIVEKMKELYSDFNFISRKLKPIEILSVISHASFFVGTSLHGNVASMSYGVGNICLDMYPQFVSKMDGLFKMIGMSERIAYSPDGLEEKLSKFYGDDSQNETLKFKIGRIQDKLSKHFDRIEEIVRNPVKKMSELALKKSQGAVWAKCIISSSSEESVYPVRIEDGHVYIKSDMSYEGAIKIFLYIDGIFAVKKIICLADNRPIQIEIAGADFEKEELRYFEGKCNLEMCVTNEGCESIIVDVQLLMGEDITRKYQEMYIDKLKSDNYEQACELKRKQGHLEYMLNQERGLLSELEDKNRVIQDKDKVIQERDSIIQEKDIIIRNKNGHIEQLLQVERDFENVKNSKFGRIMYAWWGMKEKLIPQGSKRRFFAKLLKKFLRHPIYMLKKCTPSRIARTLHYIRTEDGNMMAERLDAATLSMGQDIERIPLELEPVIETRNSIAEYDKIVLPNSEEEPLVSIIIPVYNQFHYTYNCLKSIVKNTKGIHYEVILADDCSTDLTKDIEQIVENIIVAKTPQNMRFLKNCNHAAEKARGKYIFFLNNDTQVLENWLSSLVELMEKDETIGMSGSMLLYPDGALQEAGGIIWKDASAWNYGHQHGPKEPEFNYVKEADYISGAAIMIRHSLWNEIGGFDERFAPAYYEDTDLAMEVRAHGYKVIYQPLSKVVHFEGISNGTDTSSGQKEYQIVNQKTFYEKWKEVLKKDHFPNGENVFLAKDRSRHKKQILVVDHYVPKHDQDAGGKCTFMYLQLFVKLGMKVTFIGDNFYPEQPYTQELNQMGIEVLYGNYYYNNWKQWLKENAHYFDYIYLQRPHISIKYIDIVKEYSDAKILYFAHDLHHIREYREYELTGNEEKLKSSQKWKKIEYELFEKADVGHVVGSYEQQVMQKAFPDKPIRNIPLYIYEEQLNDVNKDFSTREDIMYVGGFGHPPNIDAVLWFGKEVFPKVLKKYPSMKWYVIGSKVTPEIQALASDNIIIMGFVPDEKLDEMYRKCRMAIVPLRVGAGVKGKVVESAYYQIPLVTTTIGAEGLDDQVGNMVVEDDADKMAEIIENMYEDYDLLCQMSDAGEKFINRYFMLNEAERVIRMDVEV